MKAMILLILPMWLLSCSQLINDETVDSRGDGRGGSDDAAAAKLGEGLGILQTGEDLPKCAKKNKGQTFFIIAENLFRYCTGDKWSSLDLAGNNALIEVSEVEKGANCANGGSKWQVGSDKDGNGKLSAGEVTQSTYVCNGNIPDAPDAELVSIAITPANESAPVGFSPQFTAVATWDNNMKLDVTNSSLLVWSSSDDDVISMNNYAGSRGWSYLEGEGTATVTATYDGGVSGSTNFTVTAAVIRSVDVDDYLELILGYEGETEGQVETTVWYSDYSEDDVTTDAGTVYVSSDPTVASVSNAEETRGTVTAAAFGCASISVTSPTPWVVPEDKAPWLLGRSTKTNADSYWGGVSVRREEIYTDVQLLHQGQYFRAFDSAVEIELDAVNGDEFSFEVSASDESGDDVTLSTLSPVYSFEAEEFEANFTEGSNGAEAKITATTDIDANREYHATTGVSFTLQDVYPNCPGNGQSEPGSKGDEGSFQLIITSNGGNPPR